MTVLKFLGIAIMTTIISISFIACSDDEDKQSNPVIGTWEITGGSDIYDIGDIYTFYSNGTVSVDIEGETNVYNYNLNSDNTILAIDYEDGDGYEKVYLEITDNSLMKWSYINYEGEYTILKRIK